MEQLKLITKEGKVFVNFFCCKFGYNINRTCGMPLLTIFFDNGAIV